MKYLKQNKRYTTIQRVTLMKDPFDQNEWQLEYTDVDIYRTKTKSKHNNKPMNEHSVCPKCHCFVPLSGRCDCE